MTTLEFNCYDKLQGKFTIDSRRIVLVGTRLAYGDNACELLLDNQTIVYVQGKYNDVVKRVFGEQL